MQPKYTRCLLLLVALALVSACASPFAPSNASYSVGGVSRASLITYQASTGGTSQAANVTLPWTYTVSSLSKGDFLYVSAQNDGTSGCIIVSIRKGDTVIDSAQSCGAFVIATASGSY